MPMNRPQTPSLQIWRFLEVVAATVGLGLALASWGLWMHYAYTRPRALDTSMGRVYSLNTHGLVVYLNGNEQFLLYYLMVLGGLLFVGAVIIDMTKKPFRT